MQLNPAERVLRRVIIDAAKATPIDEGQSGLITYTELGAGAEALGFHWTYPMIVKPFRGMGAALGKIVTYEHSLGRPLLSALVVKEQSRRPGAGFSQIAATLGRMGAADDAEKFWSSEVEDVIAFWREAQDNLILDAAMGRALELLRLIRRDL